MTREGQVIRGCSHEHVVTTALSVSGARHLRELHLRELSRAWAITSVGPLVKKRTQDMRDVTKFNRGARSNVMVADRELSGKSECFAGKGHHSTTCPYRGDNIFNIAPLAGCQQRRDEMEAYISRISSVERSLRKC
jgi:hypothetical protein